jgi:hypothetical protein
MPSGYMCIISGCGYVHGFLCEFGYVHHTPSYYGYVLPPPGMCMCECMGTESYSNMYPCTHMYMYGVGVVPSNNCVYIQCICIYTKLLWLGGQSII